MPTFNSNTVISLPTSNIFENLYTKFEFVKIDSVDTVNIVDNEYINKYYKNTNKVIKISEIFNKYMKCGGIHTITSEEEWNFFLELDGIPLTKKYYYTLDSKNNITHIENQFKVSVTLNVYNLVYDLYFKNKIFTNGYLKSESYINSLPFKCTVNLDIIFRENEFIDDSDFTNYTNSEDFEVDFLGHLNCIMFDDIIILDIIENESKIDIISEVGFGNKFIFHINDEEFFVEGDIDVYSFKIMNKIDGTILNNINLEISHVPLYKNTIYIKSYDSTNSKVIYDLCLLDRFYPITSNYMDTEYYHHVLGDRFLFDTLDVLASTKLINKHNVTDAKFYTEKYFNNIYYVETIESESYNVINILINIDGTPRIIKSYPFSSLEEKFKISAVLPHSSNLHYVRNYIGNPNKLVDYQVIDSTSSSVSSDLDGKEKSSKMVDVQYTIKELPYITNGNIVHTQKDTSDLPVLEPTSLTTKTYGSYLKDLKFFGSPTSLDAMAGDLVVPCYEGYASPVGDEHNLAIYKTLNKMNTSQPILTHLNEKTSDFTFIFMTNKYGYLNNWMKIGDFLENIYGKIIICKDINNSLNNMVYNVPITELDTTDTYDSILHIIINEGNRLRYEAWSDTTLYCSLDVTTDISNCNLSLFNIVTHKKTDNWTTLAETDSTIPNRLDLKYYHNTIQLDLNGPPKKYYLDAVEWESCQFSQCTFGSSDGTMIHPADTLVNDIMMIIETEVPASGRLYLGFGQFNTNILVLGLKGRFPDNLVKLNDNVVNYGGELKNVQNSTKSFYSYSTDFTSTDTTTLATAQINLKTPLTPGEPILLMVAGYNEWALIKPYGSTSYILVSDIIPDGTYTPTYTEEALPSPLGYTQYMEDLGYNKHKDKIEEYMSVGHTHVYNQALPTWRLNKIKQLYWQNRTNNTALYFD